MMTSSVRRLASNCRHTYWCWVLVASSFLAVISAPLSAHPHHLPPGAESGVILRGTVVTMNTSGDVIADGLVWVKSGTILGVASSFEGLEALRAARTDVPAISAEELRGTPRVDTQGVIYPGLIDLHNHPEYAIYPLLPIRRAYKDRYEWRFYDDDYAKRITHLNTLLTQPAYFGLAAEVGRYGEYMAVVGGTTTLQGGRVSQPYAKQECLARNIETSPVTARPGFTRVDIGRDLEEWRRIADERSRGTVVVHLAEGVGPRMAAEFEAIKRSGLLGPELVVVHGIALTPTQFQEMAKVGAKLVWSPLSNFLLYGQTADIRAAHAAGVAISLAPDWAPSGSKSSLGELKVADLVNRHALGNLFTDRDLVAMVTSRPAAALGWQDRLGQITTGFLADLIVVDRIVDAPYRNLISAQPRHLRLTMVRGEAVFGEAELMSKLRAEQDLEGITLATGAKAPAAGKSASHARRHVLAPNCVGSELPSMRFAEVAQRLQRGLDLDISWLAKSISQEQFARDMALCTAAGAIATSPTSAAPSAESVRKLLRCRFGLPFERTVLNPLTVDGDATYWRRLTANPNLPSYLKQLPRYSGAPVKAPGAR
jgi:5-methylthioadenosine/S-adenosylhomocysteine deaminase